MLSRKYLWDYNVTESQYHQNYKLVIFFMMTFFTRISSHEWRWSKLDIS